MPEVTRVAVMLYVNTKGELLLQLRDDKPESGSRTTGVS